MSRSLECSPKSSTHKRLYPSDYSGLFLFHLSGHRNRRFRYDGNHHSGNQEPLIPESETEISPCEIIRLAQPKLKVSQHSIALSSDVSKKTADKVLKGRGLRKKVMGKRKEPSD